MIKIIFGSLLGILFLFEGCASMIINEPKYIQVSGNQFTLGDKPYYFVGTNLWYGCYIGSPGVTGDRERLNRELDRLHELGINNLRVLAASEDTYIKKSLQPTIQPMPGEYNEELLEGLDYLLSEMGKREMHAVIFLNNYWEWSGGFSAYNKWFGDGKIVDPYDPNQSWGEFMNYCAEFYRNEKANDQYKKFIFKIVTRENKYSGKYYYEDPTIMAWQLANEPRPGVGDEALPYVDYYYKWIDETAMYIHSIDQNHLVSSGSEGVIGSLQNEEIFLKAHQSKNIDYLTFHLWAKNWGWYDPNKSDETYPTAEKNAMEYINQHIELARKLKKPITMEEFGLGRDSESYIAGDPSTIRDKYFEKIFGTVYDSAKAGAPIAGLNFWAWGGEGRAKNVDFVWKAGDPFVGDPPHEPQGVYSIYDTDSTTIKIISDFADRMNKLNEKINK
ncbi:MAG: mannanase [Ignavibacteriales bacterium]|nr:mannanase [Ignavibacteriales bacterium]